MGTDRSIGIGVGFHIDYKLLKEKFTETIPEKTKLETRYDPRTGKKLPNKVKVTIPEQTVVRGTDLNFSDPDILIEYLSNKFDCEVDIGSRCYGEVYSIFMEPRGLEVTRISDVDGGDELYVGSSIALDDQLWKNQAKLLALKKKLDKAGLDPREPRIAITWSVD